MTITAVPATLERLLSYLAACGGTDRFDFHDFRGEADPLAARRFAEDVRERFHDHLGSELLVEQVANHITLRRVA